MLTHLKRTLSAFRRDRRGNVAVLAAVAMPVLLGSLGIGAEVASWYSGKRSLQNAADSAAIAAATNASAGYINEARAVARQYGLQHGVDGVTVTAVNNAACPGGGANCYRVTITRTQPLLLAQVVGFQGDVQLDGQPAKRLSATALAIQALAPRDYCVLALAGSGATDGIRANGSPNADLTGCKIMSNTSSNCNGHSLLADYSDAHVTSSTCGRKNISHVPTVSDPYAGLRANIPANPCTANGYYWIPTKKNDPPLPSSNNLQGLDNRTSIKICGDAKLTGPTLLSGGNNVQLIIYGGSLDLSGYTLQTLNGSKVTIIFTGPHFTNRDQIPKGNGTFDIQAPTTGAWKGVAIYQDPNLTSGVDVTAAGNAPAWNISGLVYLPHSNVTFSGIVNKSAYGASCFGMVVDNMVVNGTAEILAHGECPAAGLALPQSLTPSRGQLVS